MKDGLTKQCDCDPDRWRKCEHAWHLVFRWAGKPRWFSLDKEARIRGIELPRAKGDAEGLAKTVRAEVESGTYQKPGARAATSVADAAYTFGVAWPDYVDSEKAHLESADLERGKYRLMAETVLRDGRRAGDVPLSAFTEVLVKGLFAVVSEGKAPATRRHYRRALARLFRWAVRQGHIKANPIAADTVLPIGRILSRKGRCPRDIEAKLLEATSKLHGFALGRRLRGFIMATIDCALRPGEVLAIQKRDLFWNEGPFGRVFIRAEEKGARKTRKSRKVPMTPRVADWLRAWERRGPVDGRWPEVAYCFGDETGGHIKRVESAWEQVVLHAHGIPIVLNRHRDPDAATRAAFQQVNLDQRDLRREGALRWYHELGYGLNEVAELLGHSDMNTLKVYLGIEQDAALAAAEQKLSQARVGPSVSKPLVKSRREPLIQMVAKAVNARE